MKIRDGQTDRRTDKQTETRDLVLRAEGVLKSQEKVKVESRRNLLQYFLHLRFRDVKR